MSEVPARILIQIREGNMNVAATGTLSIESSRRGESGELIHEVDSESIVELLFQAIEGRLPSWIAGSKDPEVQSENVADWLIWRAAEAGRVVHK